MDINLVLLKKDGSQKSFSLPSSITVIGRRHDCDLCIPLADVSRRHCQFDRNNEALQIRDLGSRNGTFLNGKHVNGETRANAGDYLQVGPLVFQIQIDGVPENVTAPPTDKLATPQQQTPPTKNEEDDDLIDLDMDDSGSFLEELEELDEL
ncbi:MAG: FHA domain-containing protein [Sedimentisphaerales bacterium]|nr:FHA domain-containing protein [Sedimentisphaerales bacterium]